MDAGSMLAGTPNGRERARWRRAGGGRARGAQPSLGGRRAAPGRDEARLFLEPLEPRILLSGDLDLLGSTALRSSLGAPAPQIDLSALNDTGLSDSQPAADLFPLDADGVPVVAGSLEVPGETDRFTFTLSERRSLYFDSLTNRSDIRWSLTGPSGAVVSDRRFDQSDGPNFSGSPVLVLEPGDYMLSVDGEGAATGAYAFRLIDLAQGETIAPGEAIAGRLDEADKSQAYRFDIVAGEALFFQRTALAGATGGGTPYWLLLGPDYEVIFDTTFADVDALTLSRPGRYTLLVEGPVYNTGGEVTYGFTLHRATTDTAPLTIGQTTFGEIERPGARDAFTFTLASPARLVFDSLTRDSGKTWSLTGPRGVEVAGRALDQSDAGAITGNPVLDLPAGSYTLTVDGTGASTGRYAFRLLDLAAATTISTDTAVSGTIGDGGAAGVLMRTTDAAPLAYPPGATNRAFQSGPLANHVTVPDSATLRPTALTLEAWVKREADAPDYGGVAMKSSSGFWSDGFGLYYTADGFINFFINNWSSGRVRANLPADEWTHVAGTYDGTKLRLYVNGTLAAERDYTAPISHSSAELRLGSGSGGDYIWRGAIDEVRLWSVARTQAEIAAARNGPIASPPASLAGYWRFDEPDGAIVGDTSGKGNNGRFTANARETIAYGIDLARGDQLLFDASAGGSGLFWRLLDPSGREVFAHGFGDVSHTVQLAGRHILLVEGQPWAGPAGGFGFTVAKQGTTTLPTPSGDPIALGARVDGTLAAAGEIDSFVFTTTGPTRLWFDSLTNAGTFHVSLVGPRGTEFESYPMSAGDRLVVLPVAGTYQLNIASVSGGTGAYAFRLHDIAAATLISYEEEVVHTANPNNAARVFAFDATAGDRIFFDATQNQTWWTDWCLFDPFGRQVFWTEFQDRIETLAHSGRYTLVLDGEVWQSGGPTEFRFRLHRVSETTAPLALDEVTTGTIAGPGDTITYTFALADRRTLYFDSRVNDGNLRWTLTGPTGTIIDNRSFSADDLPLTLGAGSYSLRIHRAGDSTGAHAFRLLDLSAAQAIAFDRRVEVTLAPQNSAAAYRFAAAAGDRIYLNVLAGATWQTDWRLIDPLGREVGRWDFNDIEPVTLEVGGAWTLLVSGEVWRTGASESYAFALHKVSGVTRPVTLGGGTGSGPLAVAGAIGGAVQFTGKEMAVVPHGAATDLTGDVTVEFWLRLDNPTAEWTPLVVKSDATRTDGRNRTYSVWAHWVGDRGSVLLYTSDATGSQHVETALGTLRRGEWQHVAAVLDRSNGQMRIVLDGVETTSGALRSAPAVSTADALRLGGAAEPWGWGALQGALDDVRLWSVARTTAQIAAARNAALVGSEAGLALYLRMDDVSGAATLAGSGPGAVGAAVQDQHDGLPGVITGRIVTPGAVDRYTFTLAEDGWLLFDSLTDNGELSVTLRGPGGLGFSRSMRSDAAEFGSANPIFFGKAGAYTLTVDASGDRQHPYAFRLLDLRQTARPVAFGETVTGTLGPGNATQAFAFEAAAGDRLYLDLLDWSRPTWHGTLRLFDPSGRQVLYGEVRDQPAQTLELAGRYVMVLEGRVWDATPASYSFRLQKVVDETTAITLGVNPAPGPRWSDGRFGNGLAFTGVDALSVPDAALDLRNAVTVEAWVRPDLYTDTWTPIFYKGDGRPEGRTYSLWLRSDGAVHLTTSDSTGAQSITTGGGLVTPGRWTHVAGVIDRASGRMRILVDGVERASGSVRAEQTVSTSTPLLIGHALESFSSHELFVGRIDEVRVWSVARSNDQIAAARDAPLSGPQTGLVLRLALDEGSGRTAADASGGGRTASLVSLAADGVTGRIDHPGQRDLYTFTLTTERRLLLDTLTAVNELRFDLTGPRGVEASDWSFTETDGARYGGSRLLVLPPGTYTATVRANGDWTGWYSFRLLDLAQATPIAKNTVQRGWLEPGAATRLVSFEAAAGERVFLDDEGVDGSIYVRLFDPTGEMLFGPTWLGSLRDLGVRRLDRAGTYVLALEGYPWDGAGQSWSLIVQTVEDQTQALTLGTAVNGAIDHRGQVDRYTFTLATETLVVMDVRNDHPSLRWSLEGSGIAYVSDRAWQGSDSENFPSSPAIRLPAGSYVLSVRGLTDTVAPYAFRLFALGSGTALTLDSSVTGTVDPASATAVYSFAGTAFERLWFDRESLSAGLPKVRVLDAAGRQVFGLAEFEDSTPFILPTSGTYTLLIEGRRYDTGTINFGFALRREAAPAAAGTTGQNFEGSAGQLPYALANWQGPPATLVTDGGNTVLRLTSASLSSQLNSVGFSVTSPGPYQTLETTFKARITPSSAGRDRSGDGMAFALLPLRLYGAGGRAPDFSEEPNLAGALGIGFDIVNNGEPSGSNNHVSLHFDGRRLAEVAIPAATLDLASGQFFTVRVLVERAAGGARVTLTLTPPGGGTPLTPFDRVFIGGLELETSRVAFAARNGAWSAHHDLDDVQVTTTAAAAGASSAVAFNLGAATGSAEMLAATGLSSLPVGHLWRHAVTLAEAKTVLLDWLDTDGQPSWTLRGPDGAVIASRPAHQADGDGGSDVAPFRLAPGTYEIAVTGLSSPTSTYRFRLLDLAQATPLTLGARVDGSLNPANETDLYRFSANAGDRVFFDHIADGGSASWRLFDPDGMIVTARNWFTADRGPYALGKTGTYVLAIEGQYWQTGTTNYAFALHRVTDDEAPLSLGARIEGEIAQPGQVDRYTFTLAETKTLYLDSLTNRSDVWFRLEGPNGSVLGPRQLNSTDSWWEGAAFRAGPGNWVLSIFASGGTTGAYALRLLDLSAGATHTPGTPSSGTLDPGNETDVWRFAGSAGQRLFFDVQQSSNASWRLLDPWGRTVFGPDSFADRGILTLAASGTYTLLVEGHPSNAGSLAYRFNLQPVSDTTEALTISALTEGEIAHAGQTRRYTFTLATETRLFIDTVRNEVDANWWDDGLRWTLSGPSGVVAERSWYRGNGSPFGSDNPMLTLPAGQYTLAVRTTSDRTGAFSFRVLDAAAATEITLGSPVSGSLAPGQEGDLYRFSAAAGDRFYFDSQQAGSGNTFWRLIGPYGEVVFAQGMPSDRDTTVLAEAGTYLLIIDGHPADSANVAYRFAVYPNPVQAPVRLGFLDDRLAPGLVLETVAVAPVGTDTIVSGGQIRVSWQVRNAGNAAAEGTWSDRVVVRRVDTGEILATTTLPYAPGAGGLAAGGTVARQATLTLPEGNRGAGNLIVQVTADVTNAIEESNRSGTAEANNGGERAFTSELAPYVDVTVEDLAVTPPSGWASGDAVVVSWTTRNDGTRPITTTLSERLTVRNTITGQQVVLATVTLPASAASPFGPGEARARSTSVTWPSGLSATGRFEFTVLTDALDAVAESNPTGTGETNNARAATIVSAPDLVVADLAVAPAVPQSGDVLTITWRDRNLGNAPTPQGWVDRLRVVNTTTNRVLADLAVPYDQAALGALPAGGAVARSATITLPAGVAGAGTLAITVTADLAPNGTTQIVEANAAGTAETNNAASLTVESQLRAYADLVASALVAPDAARGESAITVGWTVTNQGPVATDANAWTDALILSRDEVIGNADDVVLGTLPRGGALGAGASYDATLTVTLPGRLEGGFFLAVRADSGNAVLEPDTRANNTSPPRPIALTSPFADLAVLAVTAPANASAGQQITIGWTVENAGDRATDVATWRDRVYLSADETLDAGDILLGTFTRTGTLAVGQRYDAALTATVPAGLFGQYRVLVQTHAQGEVYEKALRANNLRAASNPLTLQSPDLVVGAIDVPATAVTGRPATISWTVPNQGSGDAIGSWIDRVFIVRDGVPGETLLAEQRRNGPLAAGASYTASVSATWPRLADGSYRIRVETDATGTLFEAGAEANNSAVSTATIISTHPDLRVTSVAAPATALSGQTIMVAWTARNAGSAEAAAPWTDRVFLNSTPDLSGSPRLLGERAVSTALAAGAAAERSLEVTLPLALSGTWYLVVQTDPYDQVNEGLDEGNNLAASTAIAITQAPLPDLVVEGLELAAASGLRSGQPATVSWTTRNSGAGASLGSFFERVRVENIDRGVVILERDLFHDGARGGAIAAGAAVSRSLAFTLPDGEAGAGTLRVTVTTDVYNQAYEGPTGSGPETNNAASLTRVSAMADYADLVVEGLAATPAAPVSGEVLEISWTSRNRGDAAAGAYSERLEVINQTTGATIADLSIPQAAGLAAGATVAKQASVRLPDGAAGTGTILIRVTTDRNNQVFERAGGVSGEGNNIATLTRTATLAAYPDLVVSDIVAPPVAAAGQTVSLTWTVANRGTRAATGGWSERILLSEDASIGGDRLLATLFFGEQDLAAGASTTRTAAVTLPAFGDGLRRIVVEVDAGNAVFERDETNNAAIDDADLVVAPALVVSLARPSVSEAAGANATTAQVTRSGDTSTPLVVNLVADRAEVTVPATVTIPAGATSTTFVVGVTDNALVDGARSARISASAIGYGAGEAALAITDDDTATLRVTFPATTVSEGAGSIVATVTRNTPTDAPLIVSLDVDKSWKASVPATITIPAGARSVDVTVSLIDDSIIEGARDLRLTAQAAGHSNGSALVTVLDNDIPDIALAWSAEAVSEGAGRAAAALTITRSLDSAQPLELGLRGDTAQLVFPPRVDIAPGERSVTIPFGVVDNDRVDGNRIALLRIDVLDGVLRVPIPGQTLTTGLQIIDDDGPTLRLTLAAGAIGEGGATTATVRRNTGTSGALTVTLSSTDTTEATVPATITIPDGADSATFTITGVLDGIPDGTQAVTILAQAAGFNAGAASLVVTDRELPDIVVRAVTLPESIRTGQTVTGRFVVANQGLGPTRGGWVDRVYLSTDGVISDDDVLVASFDSTPLGVGEAYERAFSFLAGQRAGEAHLIVVSDPAGALEELSRGNNLGAARFTAAPAYRAIAETAIEMAPAGTPIPISGRAFDAVTDAPAAFQPVTVQITAPGGQVRSLTAFSDASGRFSVTFRPFANEAGRYRIAADHPGVVERTAQDEFVLLAIAATASPARLNLVPNVEAEGTIELRNLADVPLSSLAVTVRNAPDWLHVTTDLPTDMAADGRATLRYRITAEQKQAVTGRIAFEIVSAEGAQVSVPLDIQVVPLTPRLVATPGYLEAGMLRGRQTLVSFEVVNNGGAATGPLTLQLPNEPWLSAATPTTLPSLGAGESTVITLRLNPAADLPLNPYVGNIVLAGTNTALNVAYRFRAVSEAVGDVVIKLTDEFTYFAEGNPPLAGGRVTLTDPFTGEVIASGTSDDSGEVRFANLREGRYAVFATGPKHAGVNTGIDVMPGTTTELELFLRRQAVSYRWTVVPIEVEDRYRLVLETVFETEVPMPVVTVDEPRLMPIVVPGQTTQMQITVRNHGLIQAEQVQVRVPDDPDLIITPLIDVIPVLPAKSAVTIPITIRLREGSPLAAQIAACQDTLTVATGSDLVPLSELGLGPLPQGRGGALAKCLGLETIYTYDCRGGQWVTVPVSLNPVFCGEDVYGSWRSLREWISDPEKANAASLGCDVIGLLMQCLGADDCVQAIVSTLCNVGGGALFGGWLGAGEGLVDSLSDILGCLCSLAGGGGGGAGGGGGGGGGGGWWFVGGGDGGGTWSTPVIWQGPTLDCRPSPSNAVATDDEVGTPSPTDTGVCAQVRLRLEQEAVITRTAFLGTLELDNGPRNLEDVQLVLDIRDSEGRDANDKFIILGPDASGFSGGPEGWMLGPNASGALRYTFIPAVGAATELPERYQIGGKLLYRESGTLVELPLLPATITVFPEAKLVLDYFWQRDVIGDDPFTDEIEPSEPFVLGLQVVNIGKGDANRMAITSAQPQIIENEKGLLIDFKIIGSQVGANPGTNSLTIDLGRIAAGETRTAKWEMISTLQGRFIEYKATFEHLDNFGGRRTSLIDQVNIHELIREVRVNHPADDRIPDFLVNDVADPDHLPDTLYLSTGGKALVGVARNATMSGSGLTRTVTAEVDAGWTYLKVPDTAVGLKLVRIERSDGTEVPVDGMAWRTNRTFRPGEPGATRENLLHLVDRDSTGSYTLHFAIDDRIAPELVSVEQPPRVIATARDTLEVTFSEAIDLATFTAADLALLRDGTAVSLEGVSITDLGGGVYRIGNLAALTAADGNYEFRVDARGVRDLGGNAGTNSASVSWAKSESAVVVAAISPVTPDPRNVAVDALEVEFSRAIDPASFSIADLVLERDGVPVALDARVVVTALSATRFRIGGLGTLTEGAGAYALSVLGAGVRDAAGTAGAGRLTETWLTDMTRPTIVELEAVRTNPRNIVVPWLDVTFSEPIAADSFGPEDLTLTRDGGTNLINPSEITLTRVAETTWRIAGFTWVSGLPGAYALTVDATGIRDLAGNAGTGSATTRWTMITGRPEAARNIRIVPDSGAASDDFLTDTTRFAIEGDLAAPGLTVRFHNLTANRDLGVANVSGTRFSGLVDVGAAGRQDIRVRVVDAAGNTQDTTITVFVDVTAPVVTELQAVTPDPRVTAVASLEVSFSETLAPDSFDVSDLRLTRDGAAVELAPAVTITPLSATRYRIDGLAAVTGTVGEYMLSVDARGVSDRAGNAGSGTREVRWTRADSLPTGIAGRIFEDMDANGVFGTSPFGTTDVGLAGWTVFLDENDNGVRDAGEVAATSGADGRWRITGITPGTYAVVAELRDGWMSTVPTTNRIMVTVAADQVRGGVEFGRFRLGAISGVLFHDRDADGLRDDGEEGLGGRTVFVDRNGNGTLDAEEVSTITAADGRYSFLGLGPGIVRVADVADTGWARTTPATSLRIISGFERSDLGLGTVRTASISGVKFEDLDGNGVRDAGEPGLAGWTIFLDLNGDGLLQVSEPSVLTGEDGSYLFAGLLPGTYIVAEVQRAGWVQTTPTGSGAGSGPLVTLSGSTVELTMEGCTCGGSWSVPEGSGLADLGAVSTRFARELTGLTATLADSRFARLSGAGVRTVLIDTGIDLDHPFFGPDRNGDGIADRIVFHWDFADDDADASDLAKGHGSHVASVIAGEDARYLGVAPGTELIVLKVFSDTGRGTFGNVEKALQWVIANAEAWNIGVVNLSLGDNGNWNSAISRYGLGDEFAIMAGLDIITVAASGNYYNQYNTLGVAYPAADPAVLAVGAVWTGDFGGPFTIATGATDFTTGADRIAAFTQRSDTMLDILAPGARFNGANARGGVQTMQGTSQAAGFVSGAAALAQELAQEVLGRRLNTAEFAALLQRSADWVVDGDDEHDNVRNTGLSFPRLQFVRLFEEILSFRSLPPVGSGGEGGGGTVVVRPQEAAAAGVHMVSVGSGENATGFTFGNFRRAEISGVVFEDADSDGTRDEGESGLGRRIVFVDANGNGLRDAEEAFAETAADGSFSLGTFGPGTISIRQLLPEGWFASTPNPAAVTPTSGSAIVLMFGATPNRPPLAVADRVSIPANAASVLDVLANDSDPDGDPLSILDLPARTEAGAVLRLENGKVIVDPRRVAAFHALPVGEEAMDSFEYVVGDARGARATGRVQITVRGENDRPVARNDTARTNEDRAVAIAVLGNDTDPDRGDRLAVSAVPATSRLGAALRIGADGRIVYDPRGATRLQALRPGEMATDTFTYTVRDAAGATARATVTVTVEGRNDRPVAKNDAAATGSRTPITIRVLANDRDVDARARLSVVEVPPASRLGAALAIHTDGTVRYDPTTSRTLRALPEGARRQDSFTYTIVDEVGARASAKVVVTVTGEAPVPLRTVAVRAARVAPAAMPAEEIVIDLAAGFADAAPVVSGGVSSWQAAFVAAGAETADPNRQIEVILAQIA